MILKYTVQVGEGSSYVVSAHTLTHKDPVLSQFTQNIHSSARRTSAKSPRLQKESALCINCVNKNKCKSDHLIRLGYCDGH